MGRSIGRKSIQLSMRESGTLSVKFFLSPYTQNCLINGLYSLEKQNTFSKKKYYKSSFCFFES